MTVARFDLRIPDERFWALTPREYRALVERFEERERRSDMRFGVLCGLVATAAGLKKEDGGTSFPPSHFFASLKVAPKPTATAPDGRPAVIVLEDSIADAWMGWGRRAQEVAAQRGMGPRTP